MSDRVVWWLKAMLWVCAGAWIAIGAMSWSGIAEAEDHVEIAKGPTCMAHAQKIFMMFDDQGLSAKDIEANFDEWLAQAKPRGLPTDSYEDTVRGMIHLLGQEGYFETAYEYCLKHL